MSLFQRTSSESDTPRRRQPASDTLSDPQPTPESSGFRRNQTMRYQRSSENLDRSERARLHHLTQTRRKAGLVLLLVTAAVILLTLIVTQFTARLTIVGVSQPVSRPLEVSVYVEAMNDYLAINPAQRLRFLLDQQALTQYVSAIHPEVTGLEVVGVTNVVEADVIIDFREPLASWDINGQSFFVDADGVVFSENYFDTPELRVVDESGLTPEQGTTVASSRLLSFTGRVVAEASKQGREVTQISLPSGSTRQVELRVKGSGSRVIMTIDRSAGEQVADMVRSLDFLKSRSVNADYIDVRVSGRAVYR